MEENICEPYIDNGLEARTWKHKSKIETNPIRKGTKGWYTIHERYMIRCSTLWSIREFHIITTMRYLWTCVAMVKKRNK
jgi:hypothetical protein